MAEREATVISRIFAPVGVGLFVCLLTLLAATILATLLLFLGWDWAPYMHTVGMAIAFTGITLGAIFAGARAGARGWLVGLMTGAGFICLCFLLCLLFNIKDLAASLTVFKTAIACLAGTIGGMLGVNFST